MHPQLHEHKHESCTDIIMQLNECHSSVFRSYFLQCNGLKKRLNVCLAAEHDEVRRANAAKAKERRKRVEAKWKEIKENS